MKTPARSLLVVLATGIALAQVPQDLAAPQGLRIGRVKVHTQAPEEGVEYGIWAATDSYKASFHGDVSFIPYLGSTFANNQTLSWRTLSVRMGATDLLPAGAVAERHRTEYRCELRFGPVTEAWDVLEQGLEQTFVIHERPAARGDLVVRGRIDTALRADSFAAQHREIAFATADGRAVASYGKAFAIDAAGRRVEALTSHDGGMVELRVPDAWLEEAAFPVVVDPLLTRTSLSSAVPLSIDIARDDTGDDLMVVFTYEASATDLDVYAILATDSWGSQTNVYSELSTQNAPTVKVAVAADPQKYCVVYEYWTPSRRIRVHLHDSGDFTFLPSFFTLPVGSGVQDWRPDVGGQVLNSSALTSTGNKFLIVFQRDLGTVFAETNTTTIMGRLLSADGSLGAEFIIFAISNEDLEFPAVNQQARRQGSATQRTEWMVVFQRYAGPGATWRTVGRMVNDVGTGTLQPELWVSTGSGPGTHRLQPRVAGYHGRYLVSYLETDFSLAPFKTPATDGHAIVAERVDWPGGSPIVNFPPRVLDGPRTQPQLGMGDVAYDSDGRSHWAITLQTQRSAGGTGRAAVYRVGYTGRLTENPVLFNPSVSTEQGIAGGITYDQDNDRFATAFGRDNSTAGTVYGNHLTWVTPAAPVTAGVSCSSATIAWTGLQQIGAEFGSLRLTAAPASVLAVAALSLGTLDQNLSSIGMSGCRLLVDNGPLFLGTVLTVTSASGASSVPLQFPETLVAMTFHGQWFHIDLGANQLDLVSTQRLSVNVVK